MQYGTEKHKSSVIFNIFWIDVDFHVFFLQNPQIEKLYEMAHMKYWCQMTYNLIINWQM